MVNITSSKPATSIGAQYGGPVLRYGKICSSIKHITFTEAESVATFLKDNASELTDFIRDKPKVFGYLVANPKDQPCTIEVREGPIVHYPEIQVCFDGVKADAKPTVTVCRDPRHSKVWLRTSYLSNGSKPSSQKGMGDIAHFFKEAEATSEKCVDYWLDTYKRVVKEKTGKNIDGVYRMTIKTIASDLSPISKSLESRTFKIPNLFSDDKVLNAFNEFLFLAYGEKVSSLERYYELSEDYRWFILNVRGENRGVGLYSKHSHEGQTDLVGVVHETSCDPEVLSKKARDFSSQLVEEIAPFI